jgi:hypothetical protein
MPPPQPTTTINSSTARYGHTGAAVCLHADTHLPTRSEDGNDSPDHTQNVEEPQLSGHQYININFP